MIPNGKHINGIRVNTNSESAMINRLDFLLGGEELIIFAPEEEEPSNPIEDETEQNEIIEDNDST